MSRPGRGARLLVRLYPAWWRARYADEFHALLAEHGLGARCVGNVARGAVAARIRGDRAAALDERRRRALAAALWAAAGCVPIAFLLGWSVDPDHERLAPIFSAAGAHPLVALFLVPAYLGLAGIGVLGSGVVVMIGGPALRTAWRTRRPDLVRPLAAIGAAGLLVIVIAAVVGALAATSAGLTAAQLQGLAPLPLGYQIARAAWLAAVVLAITIGTSAGALLVRRTPLPEPADPGVIASAVGICAAVVLAGFMGAGATILVQAPGDFDTTKTLAWMGMLLAGGLPLAGAISAPRRGRRPGRQAISPLG